MSVKDSYTIDHLHFSTLILKLYFLLELFPFKAGNGFQFQAKLNENNIYFFPKIS